MECSLKSPEVYQLSQKFNETTSELSGFSLRSPLLWSEIYNNQETHLLLAKEDTRTLGYLIVALHLYSTARIATISELCVWERKQETANALLNQAQFFAKQMNATALVSWESSEDKINQALYQFGFLNVGKSVFSIGVTSIDFIKKTLESNNKPVPAKHAKVSKNILVNLGNKRLLSYSGVFTARINPDGTVSVEEGESGENPYARIQTDIVTFSEIILALRDPLTALFLGKIKIKPVTKTLRIIKILRQLSNRVNWYLPLGDYF